MHLTIDLVYPARFGPDVEWIDEVGYTVNPARAENFVVKSATIGLVYKTMRYNQFIAEFDRRLLLRDRAMRILFCKELAPTAFPVS